MIIGIVSTSNERHKFYKALLLSHTLLHFTPVEILSGRSVSCDGFLLDIELLSDDRRKFQKLLNRMRGTEVFAFMPGDESPPCVLRNNFADGLKLQCGRLAAIKEPGRVPVGRRGDKPIYTLIFQDDSDDYAPPTESLRD
ncbi:MAG: hypothetical protein PHG47_10350 [Sulfuricella sp.]|nr:hypothetical protein [Sulfuricella sp.]